MIKTLLATMLLLSSLNSNDNISEIATKTKYKGPDVYKLEIENGNNITFPNSLIPIGTDTFLIKEDILRNIDNVGLISTSPKFAQVKMDDTCPGCKLTVSGTMDGVPFTMDYAAGIGVTGTIFNNTVTIYLTPSKTLMHSGKCIITQGLMCVPLEVCRTAFSIFLKESVPGVIPFYYTIVSSDGQSMEEMRDLNGQLLEQHTYSVSCGVTNTITFQFGPTSSLVVVEECSLCMDI